VAGVGVSSSRIATTAGGPTTATLAGPRTVTRNASVGSPTASSTSGMRRTNDVTPVDAVTGTSVCAT
jgi:hypothetical protein